jgi:pimeloyl-ACP methyl ester carboxylesterase
MNEPLRRVALTFDDNFNPLSRSALSATDFNCRAMAVWPARTPIPVIFIPGIMGSNLISEQDKAAWRPPNGGGEKVGELKARVRQKPAERQRQLNPETVKVWNRTESVTLGTNYPALDSAEAGRRYWGEVFADGYLPFLRILEDRLNYPFEDISGENPDAPKRVKAWDDAIAGDQPHPWTPVTGFEVLTDGEFANRFGKIYFPVFACGYNWLKSNDDSADLVVKRVDEVIARISKSCYFKKPEKVILVTHSMGGLVARRAAQKLGDKVLGVVHGVMPTEGAPVTYRRFKAGTEASWDGLVGWLGNLGAAAVLGWDAADITCVMANASGPLELLPTKRYPPGWLKVTDGKKTIALPKAGGNPYSDIYGKSTDDCWWGMVDPDLIDPGKLLKLKPQETPHGAFRNNLQIAEAFHDTIAGYCHGQTYAHYGDDPKQPSFVSVTWRTNGDLSSFTDEDVLTAHRGEVDLLGPTEAKIDKTSVRFKLEGKDGPGDGTVPAPSGHAVADLHGIRTVFRLQGLKLEHADSYKNSTVHNTVLYAIGKIAQQLPLNSNGTTG